jgi:hypothetical protein
MDRTKLPSNWIPVLAAAIAIGYLPEIFPLWVGFIAVGIVVIGAAIHLFNLFTGRPHA